MELQPDSSTQFVDKSKAFELNKSQIPPPPLPSSTSTSSQISQLEQSHQSEDDDNFKNDDNNYDFKVNDVSKMTCNRYKTGLRKRNTAKNRIKNVEFMSVASTMHCNKSLVPRNHTETIQTDDRRQTLGIDVGQHRFAYGAKFKKIVFNGTFPIDDPYSSRFDQDGNLLQ